MKCPNCGAEVGENGKFCGYCGSELPFEVRREVERVNKPGCPKCGSSNIQFYREKRGEYKSKYSKRVEHATVGLCKDCGYTWDPTKLLPKAKKEKSKIVWYVIGAILLLSFFSSLFGNGNSSSANESNYQAQKESAAKSVAETIEEKDATAFLGLLATDIFRIYGTDYEVSSWQGNNYFYYDSNPYLFYYDSAGDDYDFAPKAADKIFAVEVLGKGTKVEGAIKIGSSVEDVEKYFGLTLNLEEDFDYADCSYDTFRTDRYGYYLVFYDGSKRLASATVYLVD